MESNRKIIFEAFKGGYFGPSTYYEVEKKNDEYLFRYYHDDYGKRPMMEYIKPVSRDYNYYNNFINNMKNITKDWEYKYYNNNIMDGEQWHISYIEDNKEYFGSNEYPSNFKEAFTLLDDTFK